MSVCIHGNLCREIYEKTGYIHSTSCPRKCQFFKEAQKIDCKSTECETCIHHKPGNPYCECCFDLDKFEKEGKE